MSTPKKCINSAWDDDICCRECGEHTAPIESCCGDAEWAAEAAHDCGCERCLEYCLTWGCDLHKEPA